jgi:cytochrome c
MRAHILKFVFAFLAVAMSFGAQAADQRASKDEAVAMVKKAIEYLRQNGKEKAFAEFSKPQGAFVDRELYVVVEDMTGTMLAHGANPKLIGKNLMDIKDMNGKAFVREQVEVAKTKGSGWVDFQWNNPVTQKMEPRSVYLERVGDYIVLSGVYGK